MAAQDTPPLRGEATVFARIHAVPYGDRPEKGAMAVRVGCSLSKAEPSARKRRS
jgi:hypothetical protein